MIKLDTSYSLGPIIESDFLGISNDVEPDNVIVTLSKNIVTCYNISAQKQNRSWSSSHKLSSEVIFEPLTKCYYGVFNYTRIGKWLQNSLMMNNMKKFNFNIKILKLLTRLEYEGAVVVFENGHCENLQEAIGNRKKIRDGIINVDETIELSKLCIFRSKAVCVIVSVDSEDVKTLRSIALESTLLPINLEISFKNKTDKLLGYCIREHFDSLNILTFWSDGFLYSNELYPESNRNVFPGEKLTEINLVNSNKPVTLTQLSLDCIGLYGAEPKCDGAALIIYNFYYNMVIDVQHFKNYTNPPILWCFENNLLLVTGRHLAVIPFTSEKYNMTLLMDKNLFKKNDIYEEIQWDAYAKEKCIDKNISTSALPQSKLNEIIISDHIKNKNDESLIQLLTEDNDISDLSLVEIMLYCSSNTEQHSKLLLKVFMYSPLYKPAILKDKIPFEKMLNILNALYLLLKETTIEEKLIDWMTLMIDCSYKEILLSNDHNVLEFIIKIRDDINNKCEYVEAVNNVNNLMSTIKSIKNTKQSEQVNSLYNIEEIDLY